MDYLMKMNLIEEENDNNEENQNFFINKKSKRSKERKINFIIEKVLLWRKLYNGFEDEKGNITKLTLEEAADKVGISKKSLDDYLIQIR
jgi:response regulator of citrate/malate metabolism